MRIKTLVIIILIMAGTLTLCTCATKDASTNSNLQDQAKSTASPSSAGTNSPASNIPASSPLPARKVYTFKTYTNTTYNCSINYPDVWSTSESEHSFNFIGPEPDLGSVGVVYRATAECQSLDSQFIDNFIVLQKARHQGFILLDNQQSKGLWDWYLDYSIVDKIEGVDFTDMTYRYKYYFKNTISYNYVIMAMGYRSIYDTYPFEEMLASFKLLRPLDIK